MCCGWLWWWRSWWNERSWQGKPKYSEKTYQDSTLSTTNPTCQTRVRTRAAAVGSQRLTASAMARPALLHNQLQYALVHNFQHWMVNVDAMTPQILIPYEGVIWSIRLDVLVKKMFIYIVFRSRNSVVSIATGYGLDNEGVGVPSPDRFNNFSSPRRPDRLWGSPNLLSDG
jgi:hypothetical protein